MAGTTIHNIDGEVMRRLRMCRRRSGRSMEQQVRVCEKGKERISDLISR